MSGLRYIFTLMWRLKKIIFCIMLLSIISIMATAYLRKKNNNEPDHLSSHLPTILEIEKMPKLESYVTKQTVAIAKLIHSAKKHARGSKTLNHLMRASEVIDKLLIHMKIEPSHVYDRTIYTPTSVCPETVNIGHAGLPLYKNENGKVDCNYGKHLSELLTIIKVITVTDEDMREKHAEVKTFMKSIYETFENVDVIIAIDSKTLANHIRQHFTKLKVISSVGKSEGYALNKIVSVVHTPFVLIARNVQFLTSESRLERLIEARENLDVAYVGASFRYKNGHWKKGCYQNVYRNFTLKYKEGYDESFHGCLYCDYSKGPFLTSTKYLKRILFQNLGEESGLYEDWFLRVYQRGDEGIVCPDSMFHTTPRPPALPETWDSFFTTWNLFQIRVPGGGTISKKCGHKEQTSTSSKAMSLCKYKEISEAIKIVMRSCEAAGAVCELQEGTTLGAIKMEKLIPWDIDYDIRFISNNCSQCKKLANELENKDVTFGDFVTRCCTKVLKFGEINYVGIKYNEATGDIAGHPILDTELYSRLGIRPTKVFFDGEWLNVPRNPAFTMRNRYGLELFQHAEHWRFTNGNNANAKLTYKTLRFSSCNTPGRHECLDRYNPDGNIQFEGLLP